MFWLELETAGMTDTGGDDVPKNLLRSSQS